jgi:serine/threonine-protein kinase HipA
MNRVAKIFFYDNYVGVLKEADDGYIFTYDEAYVLEHNAYAISKTLPLQQKVFLSKTLFAFFDGLIPEGWLLDLAEQNWKLQAKDRFGLLLACCKNCIGAVSVIDITKNEEL